MAESTERRVRKRTNGEGSLYLAADSRWHGAITWTDPSGIRHRKTFAARLQSAVKERMSDFRRELDRDAGIVPKGTVGEYLTAWLVTARQDIRPATWHQRSQSIETHVIPALGPIQMSKLSPADVERMTAAMVAAGKSPTTASLARVILRRALADALRDGLVPRNAAALARPPRKERHELVYLDAGQLRQLLESCREHPLGPLVTLAATTGLRRGELLGLRWSDITGASLTVRRSLAITWDGSYQMAEPKTKRSRRTINLPVRGVEALSEQKARQQVLKEAAGSAWQDQDGLVFTDQIGLPLSGGAASHRFTTMLRDAALPRVPFHALRHSFATALLTAGVPLKVVSETLGHSSIAVTGDVYAHVAPELRKDAADALDRALR